MTSMTNWVTRLLAILFLSSLAGVVFLYLFLDIAGWMQIAGYAVPPVLAVLFLSFSGCAKRGWVAVLLLAATAGFNVPLQNWLFHSADDIVQYPSVEALFQPENKALYFRFDTLDYHLSGKGTALITRTHTRRVGRHRYKKETTQHTYTVVPVFADTLPRNQYRKREVVAWIGDLHKKDLQQVVCFERCRFNLEDYQTAAGKSPCKRHRADAPFIRPLYQSFITQTEWRMIFLKTFCIVTGLLIFVGIFLNRR